MDKVYKSNHTDLINKGPIAEVATGNELIAYASAKKKHQLFYWHRENKGSNAEIDYLLEQDHRILPLEVKAGDTGKMQSMRIFLDSHKSEYGIRVSMENGGEYNDIKVCSACKLFCLY